MQNGTTFSKFFSYIDPGREFLVRTTIAAIVFVYLCGLLLYLASTTSFQLHGHLCCITIP
jgi:hypothetical protein